MKQKSIILIISIVINFGFGCARAPIKSIDQAMRPTGTPKNTVDDLGLFDLAYALQANIERLKSFGDPLVIMKFGAVEISKKDYIEGLKELISALQVDPSGELYLKTLRNNFEFYEVYGGDNGWGSVFITSYYEPILKGSHKAKKPYTQPLFGVPKDLVLVNVAEFAKANPQLTSVQKAVTEQSRDGLLKGRIISATSNDKFSSVVPYYTRKEIDENNVLKGFAPTLCYVDPIDAFSLQIQGSGRVIFSDGQELRLGYAAQNGHSYFSIGKMLFDVIPKEEMTAQKIMAHLRGLPEKKARELMNNNKSYVFFQKLEGNSVGYFGAEVVAGRTIATDQKYFPKGALAYLEYEKPKFENLDTDAVKEWVKSSRFVLDQDTGGAIRGPGRVDLFWGSGSEAAQVSGVMRNPGRLYYILPKKKAL